jgi:hypothetical protein
MRGPEGSSLLSGSTSGSKTKGDLAASSERAHMTRYYAPTFRTYLTGLRRLDSCVLPTYQPVWMLSHSKVNRIGLNFWFPALSNFVPSRRCVWEIGETRALAALESSQYFVSPPLRCEVRNVCAVVSRNCSSGGTPHAPVISARQLSSEEKRKYERSKTFAEFLDTVGYGDGSGLPQQRGRASEIQSSGFGSSAS